MVAYNNKKYYIDIFESKPASAITIIEMDCEVDFAPPHDYKEPGRAPANASSASTTVSQGLYWLTMTNILHDKYLPHCFF